MKHFTTASMIFFVFVMATSTRSRLANADTIELVNGDLLHGRVVSLDASELRLVSEIHGAVIIDRDKVAGIALGDRKFARLTIEDRDEQVQAVVRRGGTISAGIVNGQPNVAATVPVTPLQGQDVIRALRAYGLSDQNIAELQRAYSARSRGPNADRPLRLRPDAADAKPASAQPAQPAKEAQAPLTDEDAKDPTNEDAKESAPASGQPSPAGPPVPAERTEPQR